MATPPTPLSIGAVLKIRDLRRLWIGQIVSIFGDFLAIFAVLGIVSFQYREDGTMISLVLISFLLPFTFVSPIAGVFVDRWNVKRTMIASDLIRSVLCFALLLTTNVWQIYGILFALSCVSSFFMPAQSVAIRSIVPKEGLMSANGLMQQVMYAMQIIAPSIATMLVGWFGRNVCFWLDAASFLVSAYMISTITISREPAAALKHVRSVFHELTAGAKFIFTHSAISFVVVAITAGMFAIRCWGALIALYVRDILKAGMYLFGGLSSLTGVGMIVGTQFIYRFARNRSKAHLVVGGLLGIGVGIAALTAFPSVAMAVVGMLTVGFSASFLVVPSQTLLQEETPPQMLGRVGGSMMSVMMGSQVLALAIAGPVEEKIGVRAVFFASAGLLALIALAGHLRLRHHVPPKAESANA
jgi:MFS family permease